MKRCLRITFIVMIYILLFYTGFILVRKFPDKIDISLSKGVAEINASGQILLHSSAGSRTLPFVHPSDDEGKDNYTRRNINKPLYPKEVFLTFDDGPSINNTPKVLNILKRYGVKATFFVIGQKVKENPEILKHAHNSGMCIVAHTNSHDYRIYKNLQSYIEDLDGCNNIIKAVLNVEPLPYVRFPGGSSNQSTSFSNMKKIKNAIREKNLRYVDWNVSSADAAAATVASDKIRNNIITQCRNTKMAVVLMHDSYSKTTTVEALPAVIEYLKGEGFVFRTFEDLTLTEEREMINLGIINRQ